jgi:Putative GTPases (G3E family)
MIFTEKTKCEGFYEKADGEPHKTEDHNYPNHNHHFKSLTLSCTEKLNRKNFKIWCEELPSSVIRGKGILYFAEEPGESWLWHKVGKTSSINKFLGNNSNSELVLIGTPEMPPSIYLKLPYGLTTITETF